MARRDGVCDRQSEAAARGRADLPEPCPGFLEVFCRYADAIVLDGHFGPFAAIPNRNSDPDQPGSAMNNGIVDEVGNRFTDQGGDRREPNTVPGTASPVVLDFLDTVGGTTGSFLPTGNSRTESRESTSPAWTGRCQWLLPGPRVSGSRAMRAPPTWRKTGCFRAHGVGTGPGRRAMGIRNAADSVMPKFGLLAPSRHGGTDAARYFMPWTAHPAMAVTGAQCLSACVLTPGTVADGPGTGPEGSPATVTLEHASGSLDVTVDFDRAKDGFRLNSSGLVRTARLLARGEVMVPWSVWCGG